MYALVGGCHRRGTGPTQDSPTFGRGGIAALFSVEIIDCDGSTSLTVVVQHKNGEDTSWTPLAPLSTMTSGVNTQTASAIKEQFRDPITVNGENAWQSVYANILAPAWRPY